MKDYYRRKDYENEDDKDNEKEKKFIFTAEAFYNSMTKQGKNLDNKELLIWLSSAKYGKYSIRLLQKWVKENIRGKKPKPFLWNLKNLIKFEKYFNKADKIYKAFEYKKKINFKTIKDIVDEYYKDKVIWEAYVKRYKKNLMRNIQKFLKQKGYKPEPVSHYYKITKKMEKLISNIFNLKGDRERESGKRPHRSGDPDQYIEYRLRQQYNKLRYNYECKECNNVYSNKEMGVEKYCPYCGTQGNYKRVYKKTTREQEENK
jgi:hypothetical protein